MMSILSYLHCRFICFPDDGSQVADFEAVSHKMHLSSSFHKRGRIVADTADDALTGNFPFIKNDS